MDFMIRVSAHPERLAVRAREVLARLCADCYSLSERICQPFQRSSATERPVLHPPSVRGAHRSVDPMELGSYLMAVSTAVGRIALALEKDSTNPRHRVAAQALPHETIITGMLLIIDGIRRDTGSNLSLPDFINAGVEASHGIITLDVVHRLSGEAG